MEEKSMEELKKDQSEDDWSLNQEKNESEKAPFDLKRGIQMMIEDMFEIDNEIKIREELMPKKDEIIPSESVFLENPENFYRNLPHPIYEKLNNRFYKLHEIHDQAKLMKVYNFAVESVDDYQQTEVKRNFSHQQRKMIENFVHNYASILESLPIQFQLMIFQNMIETGKNAKLEINQLQSEKAKLMKQKISISQSIEQIITSEFSNQEINKTLTPILDQIRTRINNLQNGVIARQQLYDKIFSSISTMGKFSSNEENKLLCQICFNRSKEFAIPCGHMFCEPCIIKIKNHDSYGRYHCPNCRKRSETVIKLFF